MRARVAAPLGLGLLIVVSAVLRTRQMARDLRPLIDELPAGRRIVLVEPIVHEPWRWDAPSTSLVRIRSEQWWRALSEDRRLRVIHFAPLASWPRKPNPVRATVYVKDPFSIPRSRRES